LKYKKVVKGSFVDRPNRFIAHVKIDDEIQTVHVKNTGRCRELLLPDAEVYLEVADNPARKTAYDLIAVYKENFGLINIDSQAPNKVAKEWLETQNYDVVKPEYKYGNSRIDFYMKKGVQEYLMEVKGCTLERQGIGYFPDAPTERGVKHLRELIGAKKAGYDYFTTTLSISPMKNAAKLNEIGLAAQKEFGVKYLQSDFKKKNGYKRSIELSKEYGLYRQDYCGCEFSQRSSTQ